MGQELDHESSGSTGAGDADKGGAGVDYESLFEETNSKLAETERTLSDTRTEFEGFKKTTQDLSSTLDRVRGAFKGGDDDAEVDPVQAQIAELEAERDEILEAKAKADASGRSIPLTVNNALKRIEFTINQIKTNQELAKDLKEMKARVGQLSDPTAKLEDTAGANMESYLVSALETIYGPDETYGAVKEVQRKAVSDLVVQEIRSIRSSKDPEDQRVWNRLIRDKNAQTNLVKHFVEQVIPPRARKIMEEDHVQKTPMTMDEVVGAWREAKQLASDDKISPQKRAEARRHVNELRQRVLEMSQEKAFSKRGQLRPLYSGS